MATQQRQRLAEELLGGRFFEDAQASARTQDAAEPGRRVVCMPWRNVVEQIAAAVRAPGLRRAAWREPRAE